MSKIIIVEIEVSDVATEQELVKELTRVVGRCPFVRNFTVKAVPQLDENVSTDENILSGGEELSDDEVFLTDPLIEED